MSSNLPVKALTLQQQNFLSALANEARGDLVHAKKLAGYSPNTALADIVAPLKDHIVALTRDIIVNAGPKAAFGLIGSIDNPSEIGTANRIKASTEVLDRIGVVKPDDTHKTVSKSAIFILPPKNISTIKVSNEGDITIATEAEFDAIDLELEALDKNPETGLDSSLDETWDE